MTAFVALAVIGHHDGRLTPNKTKIFGGKNLVGGFRTPRWPITAKQDKNFWGKNLVGGFRTPRWPITANQDKNNL